MSISGHRCARQAGSGRCVHAGDLAAAVATLSRPLAGRRWPSLPLQHAPASSNQPVSSVQLLTVLAGPLLTALDSGQLWLPLPSSGRLWSALPSSDSGRLWFVLPSSDSGQLGSLCPALDSFGPFCPALDGFGWPALNSSRQWTALAPSAQLWTALGRSVQLWTALAGSF